MARVQAGQRAALTSALDGLFADAGESSRPYSVSDELMVVSDSPSHLAWAVSHLGQGAGSPFAAAIGDRYKRGAGWLIGVDAAPVIAMAAGDDAPPIEFAGMTGVKYLFLEQRSPAGAEENEVTVTFQDARKGMASWLADAGSGGAAEYLPADALVAGYVSMRAARPVVPGVHGVDVETTAVLPKRADEAGGDARRRLRREPHGGDGNRSGVRAAGILRQRPDVGDGRPGERPGGHRQLALEGRGHVQRRAAHPTSRTSEPLSRRRAPADGRGRR